MRARTVPRADDPRPTQKCWKWTPSAQKVFRRGRMNVPLYVVLFAQLIRAAAVTGSIRVSPEQQLLEASISGRRTGRLYCRVGIGFHLQIHPDGRVNGSHEPNQLSKFKIKRLSIPFNIDHIHLRTVMNCWTSVHEIKTLPRHLQHMRHSLNLVLYE